MRSYLDDTQKSIERIPWLELPDCSVIVLAKKQGNDAVHFSRINVYKLIFLVKRLNYPTEIVRLVEEHLSSLDQLLFAAGFDYRMERNHVVILKSGHDGIFQPLEWPFVGAMIPCACREPLPARLDPRGEGRQANKG